MNLEMHKQRDDMKVWLSNDEIETLIGYPDRLEKRIAFALGARCGLRSHEILDVRPSHAVETESGWFLRVWEGKGDKYRETPLPPDLATRIETIDEMREGDDPIVSVTSTRSLRRWVKKATLGLRKETDDKGWTYVSTHDLRRSWAGQLRSADVDAMVVLNWGGWNDLETFLNHYKGEDTPETQLRERTKVDWL